MVHTLQEPPRDTTSRKDAEEEIPAVLTNLNIDDGPFTAAELARAKSTLRQGKSAGPDGIPPEVYKYCNLADLGDLQPVH